MTRVRLLDSICRKKTESIDGSGLQGVCHVNPDEWNLVDFTIEPVTYTVLLMEASMTTHTAEGCAIGKYQYNAGHSLNGQKWRES
jgi:hypothetical protein